MAQRYFIYARHRYDITSNPKRFPTRALAEKYIQREYGGFGVSKKLTDGWAVGRIVVKFRRR